MLINRPSYAFLDEATAALDRANQERLYRLLRATGVTFISVSHNPELVNEHEQVLELLGDGSWKIDSPPPESAAS